MQPFIGNRLLFMQEQTTILHALILNIRISILTFDSANPLSPQKEDQILCLVETKTACIFVANLQGHEMKSLVPS